MTDTATTASSARYREFLIWTFSWPLFFVFNVFRSSSWLIHDYDNLGTFLALLLFGVVGISYAVAVTLMSRSLLIAFLRVLALTGFLMLGLWERAVNGLILGAVYIVVFLITFALRASIFRAKQKPATGPVPSSHAKLRWVWIAVPMAALVWALLVRSILTAKFGSVIPGTDIIAWPFNLPIDQCVTSAWVSAVIFGVISLIVLLVHKFEEQEKDDAKQIAGSTFPQL